MYIKCWLKNYKVLIKKFKRRKVYARIKNNTLAVDLVEMGSLYSFNRGIKYLLCIIGVFTKYTWDKALKDKKGKTFKILLK